MADGHVAVDTEGDQDKSREDLADVFGETEQLTAKGSEHPEAHDLVENCHGKRQHGDEVDDTEHHDIGQGIVVPAADVAGLKKGGLLYQERN